MGQILCEYLFAEKERGKYSRELNKYLEDLGYGSLQFLKTGMSIPWRKSPISQWWQSPDSTYYTELRRGLPFLQGTADFGDRIPLTIDPLYKINAKYAKRMTYSISVRAPVGELNVADQKYCIGRGLSSTTCEIYKILATFFVLRFVIRASTVASSDARHNLRGSKSV